MKTLISIIAGVALIAIGLFAFTTLSSKEKKTRAKSQQVIQTVFVKEVENGDLAVTINESGRLVAKNRIEIFAEVQGVMEPTGREFKPGAKYSKGQSIVKIRSKDYVANLQAQKSTLQNLITSILPDLRLDFPEAFPKWDTYVRSFDMEKAVPELPEAESEKERFFLTGRNIYTTYYNTKNMELVLQKYNLRAPFSGILTEALVTPGSLVRPGQKLGEFIEPTVFELEVAVSQSAMSGLKEGKKVLVREVEANEHQWEGEIVRINGRVNTATQTVQVFILVRGDGLREGMYLEALMSGEQKQNAFEINRSLLVNDSQVYVVRDSSLALVDVKPVFFSTKTALVEGLENGEIVVNKPVPGAYPGMKVKINSAE